MAGCNATGEKETHSSESLVGSNSLKREERKVVEYKGKERTP